MTLLGAGLGLRRGMLDDMRLLKPESVGFFEVAPENWMHLGGRLGKTFRELTERFTFACHGLSLSIGSADPLDTVFLNDLKTFLDQHNIQTYSEHLSYCSHNGHMYDLMPIPFSLDSAKYVAQRVEQVQAILQRPLILENVSSYVQFESDMSELEFIKEVVTRSGCKMLLDVNNVYVNSVNHRFNPQEYIQSIPSKFIGYYHIAGHFNEAPDLLVDTHGSEVIPAVWDLLALAYECHGVKGTLLERDFNFPSMHDLSEELNHIKILQAQDLMERKHG